MRGFVRFLTVRSRSVMLTAVMLFSLVFVLNTGVRTVSATSTLTTNWNDEYSQSWTGLRPSVLIQAGTNVNAYQRVLNYNHDTQAETFLSAEVYQVHQGGTIASDYDSVSLRLTVNANSRYGLDYGFTDSSLPSPYPTSSTGWTALGKIEGMVTLQHPLVFYGDYPTGTGVYSSVYVSQTGYISVVGQYLGPLFDQSGHVVFGRGVIAPLERTGQTGNVWMWYDSQNHDTWFRWEDTFVDQNLNSNNEYFLVVLRDWNGQFSPYGESSIEFWYHSVTRGDGAAIGIANQYASKTQDASAFIGTTDNRLVFSALQATKYLSSLKFTLVDTSNGVTDDNAWVKFDPNLAQGFPTTYNGEPAGNNIVFATTVPGSLTLPDYAKNAFSLAGQIGVIGGTAGMIFDGVGAVPLAIDTYNQLINAYWYPSLSTAPTDQSSFTDPNPAVVKVSAAQGVSGGTSTTQEPTDASFSIKVLWLFKDTQNRNVLHHLQVTATTGYCCFAAGGTTIPAPDNYGMSTSVDLEVDPDYLLQSDTFVSGGFASSKYTNPSAPGVGAWSVTSQCNTGSLPTACFASANSAYSGPAGSAPSANTNYGLTYTWGSLANYAQLIVYLHLWIPTGQYLFIDYLSGGAWHNAISALGGSDTGSRGLTGYTRWLSPRIVLPISATAMRFTFTQGTITAPTSGAYIGDIYVFGDGPAGSSNVHVQSSTDAGASLSAPISMDGGSSYPTPDYFLATTTASHQFTAPLAYTDSTGTYNFEPSSWSTSCFVTGTSSTTSCSLMINGPTELSLKYVVVPDFALFANPASPGIYAGYSGTVTITLTSRNHWVGSVSLSSTVSPSGLSVSCSPSTLSLTDDGTAQSTCNISSTIVGSYTIAFTGSGTGTGTFGISNLNVPVSVCCSGSGGGSGSGSLAAGTLITMADGSAKPVQNILVGDSLLGYDPQLAQYSVSTVLSTKTVVTNNMVLIYMADGKPFRTDNSPTEVLWTELPNRTSLWLPVTQMAVGDSLYSQNGWVAILSIRQVQGSQYTMYDLATTKPYFANGYLDPINPS